MLTLKVFFQKHIFKASLTLFHTAISLRIFIRPVWREFLRAKNLLLDASTNKVYQIILQRWKCCREHKMAPIVLLKRRQFPPALLQLSTPPDGTAFACAEIGPFVSDIFQVVPLEKRSWMWQEQHWRCPHLLIHSLGRHAVTTRVTTGRGTNSSLSVSVW